MIETRAFDIQTYLETPEDRAAYLEAILEEGDPSLIAAGLGEIARAVGVTEFASDRPQPGGDLQRLRARRKSDAGHARQGDKGAGVATNGSAGGVICMAA